MKSSKKVEREGNDTVQFQSTGAEAAYERFVSEAEKLDAKEVIVFRADARLALQNVQTGCSGLLGERERLKRELPALPVADVEALPELAMAVVFAASRVDRGATASTGEIRRMYGRAQELRTLLITAASSLALVKLIPERSVKKIREGKGPIDAAEDCVALVALFRAHPDAAKRTVVTAAHLREAAELGTKLLDTLQPSRTKSKRSRTPAEVADAAHIRDRLWTLLQQRYDRAWRAGVWLFGKDVEAHVPLLLAYATQPKKGSKNAKDAESHDTDNVATGAEV